MVSLLFVLVCQCLCYYLSAVSYRLAASIHTVVPLIHISFSSSYAKSRLTYSRMLCLSRTTVYYTYIHALTLYTCLSVSHPSLPPFLPFSLPPYFLAPPSKHSTHNPGCPQGSRHKAATRAWIRRRSRNLLRHASTRGNTFNTKHTNKAFRIHTPTLSLSLVPWAPTGAISHSIPLRAHCGTFLSTPE